MRSVTRRTLKSTYATETCGSVMAEKEEEKGSTREHGREGGQLH